MSIDFIDLGAQQARIRSKIDARINSVLEHGKYIMGPEVAELEKQLAAFCGVPYALTCANGTDALHLALMALEVKSGDAVFVPSFTFAASAEVVPLVGATPVFVDIDPKTYNMDVESLKRAIVHARKSGLKPMAVIPVDLFGLAADYDAITEVSRNEKLFIVEDSAQGLGATYKGAVTGSFGDIATTSFFPAKPLGCYGDGGAVFTKNSDLADRINSLRVHGKGTDKYDNVRIGVNSRLDTLQAAILLEKLVIYPEEIETREKIASTYTRALSDFITTPVLPEGQTSVWAQYTLQALDNQSRSKIMAALKSKAIPSVVYYPTPLHLQTAYRGYPMDPAGLSNSSSAANRVFSIPMSPYLKETDQQTIIDVVVEACTQNSL